MAKELIISSSSHETKLAILEDDQLAEIYFERPQEHSIAGAIYKGKVKRVLPGMQSAFVDIGLERDAFLYVSDFFEDNEEYDKVVSGVEEKIARMQSRGAPEARDERAPAEREPARPAVQAGEAAPGITEAPAPPSTEASIEAGEIVQGEGGNAPGDRGGRRRRSRRRRFRDRGFPESKYASPTDIAAPEHAARPAAEPAAEIEAAESQEERTVLPGESLAKYREQPAHAGFVVEREESSSPSLDGGPEGVDPAMVEAPLSQGERIEVAQQLAESESGAEPAATPAEGQEHATPVVSEPEPASSGPVGRRARGRRARGDAPAAAPIAPASVEARYDTSPDASFVPAQEAPQHAGPPEAAAPPPDVPVSPGNSPRPLDEVFTAAGPFDADGPPVAEDTASQTQMKPFASPAPAEVLSTDIPVSGQDAIVQKQSEQEAGETAVEVEPGETPDDVTAPAEPAAPGQDQSTAPAEAASNAGSTASAEDAEAKAEEGEDSPGAEEGEQPGETRSEATVRGPSEPARFTQRLSRRMRRKLREQQQAPPAAPARPERVERPERPERPERAERPERGERERPPVPLITDLLREGQEIIVQIAKEPLGKKGARITSHVALPGRYVVYMPTVDHVGVSRKIASDEERLRLKRIMQDARKNIQGGFIVRTAAENRSEEDLRRDIDFQAKLWIDMRQRAERRSAPALLHHDLNLIERILRDQLSDEFTAIWVDSETGYEKILDFVQNFQPSLVSRVKLYTKDAPIFEEFGIQDEINKSLKPKVWLKSGGYIVINQTEALVAIDVNTGKYVGKTQRLEDTIVKTNVDAIKEIVRQIRLRDLGGIIVIDFIDMDERKNRQKVMQALEEALRADRAPSKILAFNDFGLVAITRKRVKQSLERSLCSPCAQCGGSGFLKSPHTIAMEILTEAGKIVHSQQHREHRKEITLRVHPDVARYLKQRDVTVMQEIEDMTKRPVLVKSDGSLHAESFDFNY